jgi:hypothetical protein
VFARQALYHLHSVPSPQITQSVSYLSGKKHFAYCGWNSGPYVARPLSPTDFITVKLLLSLLLLVVFWRYCSQDLVLARQAFYHMSYTSSPLCLCYFSYRVSCFCPDYPQSTTLLILPPEQLGLHM